MPMELEQYENLLNELNSADLTHERRTEILQELRKDYNTVVDEHKELSTSTEKLKEERENLLITNSKLFRQLGQQDNPELKQKQEKESFSETVTLDILEN